MSQHAQSAHHPMCTARSTSVRSGGIGWASRRLTADG